MDAGLGGSDFCRRHSGQRLAGAIYRPKPTPCQVIGRTGNRYGLATRPIDMCALTIYRPRSCQHDAPLSLREFAHCLNEPGCAQHVDVAIARWFVV